MSSNNAIMLIQIIALTWAIPNQDICVWTAKQPINSLQYFSPSKGMTSPEVTTESAAAPLIDTKRARQDVVAVVTALHPYGGRTFAKCLFMSSVTCAMAGCAGSNGRVLPLPGVPAEGRRGIKNGIKMTQRSRLEGGREMRCRLQRRIGHIGFQIGSRGLYCNEN